MLHPNRHSMPHPTPNPRSALPCLLTTALLTSSLLLAGCASQQVTRTGFLSGYEALVPAASDASFRSYVKPDLSPGQYTHYLLDPVTFESTSSAALTEAETAQLKTDLTFAVRQSFETKFQPAAQAGPGVFRLRVAITGVEKSNPGLNVAMAILIVPLANGGASTEAEALDSITGERLVALLASSNGSLVKGEFAGFFSEFGHARLHFSKQADALRDHISPPAAASAASR
jgi:Protein of unknown function (DUF3313)